MGSVKKLLGGALGVLSAGGTLAGHVAWWVRYQMDGTVHEDETAIDD